MKSLIPWVVLSFIAPATVACGSDGGILDRVDFCDRPVIRYPDPGRFVDKARECCVFGDPWIAANNVAGCCICRNELGHWLDWPQHDR
jgi:hypothetical protein